MGGKEKYFAHESAYVDKGAAVGEGTKVWHFCHIMAGARVGSGCSLGQNVMVADGAVIGDGVKVQNNVSIYEGVQIEDEVFLGPSCVLTNVINPRSQVSRKGIYEKTVIRRGATVGANATIMCGITVGRYAFIAAGAVVTEDVGDYELAAGVPAVQKGWMSRHGVGMEPNHEGIMVCRESGYRYELKGGVVRCLDLGEDEPLPDDKAIGRELYREIKNKRSE